MLKLNIPSQPLSQIPINYFRQARSLTRKSCQKGLDLTGEHSRTFWKQPAAAHSGGGISIVAALSL